MGSYTTAAALGSSIIPHVHKLPMLWLGGMVHQHTLKISAAGDKLICRAHPLRIRGLRA